MSVRYGNEGDSFAAISTLPEVLATLRRRLTATYPRPGCRDEPEGMVSSYGNQCEDTAL